MANFYETLLSLLKTDARFVAEDGTFLRNAVYEAAMKMDAGLIKLLLSNEETSSRFFTDVNDIKVFDKTGFSWVINNRQFLPDSYTRFKNHIGLADENGDIIASSEKVELVFPYKDCVLEGGQTTEEQKRSEIFYNETLAPDEIDRLLYPKVFVGATRYTTAYNTDLTGQPIIDSITVSSKIATTFEDTDNLIVKGNNLLAISSLLKRFEGQIKCIYIDPPYYFDKTTATDTFKYNSNFHLSTWLVFMKDRLTVAKKLLCKGGTIWINISEDGMHYLKVMADDIFGKEHFVATIPRRTRNGKSDVPFNLSQDFDWVLVYTNVGDDNKVMGRSIERQYYETEDFPGRPWRLADLTKQTSAKERPNSFFTMIDPKTGKQYPASEKRTWCVSKDTFQEYYDKGYIVFPDDYEFLNISKPYSRKFKDEDEQTGKLSAVISDFLMQDFLNVVLNGAKNSEGNSHIDELFGIDAFNYSKPENLIKAILDVATNEGDIVLDFFLGSGTTAAVAQKMNRRFIGVEQLEYVESLDIERLKKVLLGEQGGISKAVNWHGGGSFVYCELAKLNQAVINEIEAATDDETLSSIYEKMINSGFISYKVNPAKIAETVGEYDSLSLTDKKRFLMEILDKNLLYVNYCDMDDEEFGITEEDKAFTRSFYREG